MARRTGIPLVRSKGLRSSTLVPTRTSPEQPRRESGATVYGDAPARRSNDPARPPRYRAVVASRVPRVPSWSALDSGSGGGARLPASRSRSGNSTPAPPPLNIKPIPRRIKVR